MGIKHTFTSAKTDGPDSTLIQPSNWNSDHTITSEVVFPQVSNVAAPSTTNIAIYGKNVANHTVPAFKDSSNQDFVMQSSIGHHKISVWLAAAGQTFGQTVLGGATSIGIGTIASRNCASNNSATRLRRQGQISSATSGSIAGMYFGSPSLLSFIGDGAGQGGFTMTFVFNTNDAAPVTGARHFVGAFGSLAAPTNVESSTLVNAIGLAQLSTDASQWYMVYGGSAPQTPIALGTAIGAPTDSTIGWKFTLYSPSNSSTEVHYQLINLATKQSITGTVSGVSGTALPAPTLVLNPRIYRTNNATALAVGVDVASVYTESEI